MKDLILNEIIKNGIFITNQLLDEDEKNSLKKDFLNKKNKELFKIDKEEQIKKISETLFNFLQQDSIKDFLRDYFGSETKCTNVLFSRAVPEMKIDDSEQIKKGNVFGFHNDDSGKQIKINILLNDLDEKSNGLEYAATSHKISKLDKFLISVLKNFGLYKNWDKHLINYQKNKIQGKKVNFMSEKEIKKKFKIIKVHGKSGLIYIFDTNGFHRQGSVETENLTNYKRELITLYFNKK